MFKIISSCTVFSMGAIFRSPCRCLDLSSSCLCNMCWCTSILLKLYFQFQEVTGRQIRQLVSKDCICVWKHSVFHALCTWWSFLLLPVNVLPEAPQNNTADVGFDSVVLADNAIVYILMNVKKNDEHSIHFPSHPNCGVLDHSWRRRSHYQQLKAEVDVWSHDHATIDQQLCWKLSAHSRKDDLEWEIRWV